MLDKTVMKLAGRLVRELPAPQMDIFAATLFQESPRAALGLADEILRLGDTGGSPGQVATLTGVDSSAQIGHTPLTID